MVLKCFLLIIYQEHQPVQTVRIASYDDGKPEIIRVAKELNGKVERDEIRLDEIDDNAVSSLLVRDASFPDPCLILVFGPVFTLSSCLPWNIGLSEIQ